MKELDQYAGKCLSPEQSKCFNTILNFCIKKGIEVDFQIEVTYKEELDKFHIQLQLSAAFGNYDNALNSFAFYFGTEDNEIYYSAIFELQEEQLSQLTSLREEFKQLEENMFDDFIEEPNDIFLVHLFSSTSFDIIDEDYLETLLKFMNGEYVKKLCNVNK